MALLKNTSYTTIYFSLSILLLFCLVLSAGTGAVQLSFAEIAEFIKHKLGMPVKVNTIYEGLFFQIRLPRTILCVVAGAALSVSGTLMQALFRNPIVEPGLIGTSAGSAFGAALVIVLGTNAWFQQLNFLGEFLMPLCAFAGGLVATLLVYYFSASLNRVNISSMILAGIAVNAIANGATGFLAYIARDPQARSITFWSLGSLSQGSWYSVTIALLTTLTGMIVALRFSKALNALQLGEVDAGYIGVNSDRLKITVVLLNTLLVSVITSVVGIIAFVGLIVPHLLRMLKGSDTRYLIIASGLLGAVIMVITDMICRVIIAPAEMPIGIVTAFLGAPVFLWLLASMKSSQQRGGFYA